MPLSALEVLVRMANQRSHECEETLFVLLNRKISAS